MRIIISPAKKMKVDTDSLPWRELPAFLPQTERLARVLQKMHREELKKLWKCSDAITDLNVERLATLDLYSRLTPALLAYEGIQYQYMAPSVFTGDQFDYVQEHLRILSGFYGVLRPFDGVAPYRLEMQAKLKCCQANDLYGYWGRSLADHLFAQTDCIIDLASREYSVCVSRYLPPHITFVTCVFAEEKEGKLVEKGTMCKMARGEMVRYMAENRVARPEELRSFDRLGYRFDAERSDGSRLVFVRSTAK